MGTVERCDARWEHEGEPRKRQIDSVLGRTDRPSPNGMRQRKTARQLNLSSSTNRSALAFLFLIPGLKSDVNSIRIKFLSAIFSIG